MKLKIFLLSLTMVLATQSINAQTVKEKDLHGKFYFARVYLGNLLVFDATSEEACIKAQLDLLKSQNPKFTASDSTDTVTKAQSSYKMARQSTMDVQDKGQTVMISPGAEASKGTWTYDEAKQQVTTVDENGITDVFTAKWVGKTISLLLTADEAGQQIELLKE